jgi:hypothetical protein
MCDSSDPHHQHRDWYTCLCARSWIKTCLSAWWTMMCIHPFYLFLSICACVLIYPHTSMHGISKICHSMILTCLQYVSMYAHDHWHLWLLSLYVSMHKEKAHAYMDTHNSGKHCQCNNCSMYHVSANSVVTIRLYTQTRPTQRLFTCFNCGMLTPDALSCSACGISLSSPLESQRRSVS